MGHVRTTAHKSKSAITIALSALLLASACTKGPIPDAGVEHAYSASGIIKVPPYERTIFSTSNF